MLPYVAGEDDSPAGISQFVSSDKGEHFLLKNPAGATLREAGLEDTIYQIIFCCGGNSTFQRL